MINNGGFLYIKPMFDENEKIVEIINSEKIDTTHAFNILINAVRGKWDQYNKVDKFLIGKVLETIEWHAENKQDFVVKFKK
jgi:hypothetical protein